MSPVCALDLPSGLLQDLERDESVIYILDSDLRIAWCNSAWDRFAGANQGERVQHGSLRGGAVLDFITEPLKGYYAGVFRDALETGTQHEHCYECSSPALYRSFRLSVLPIAKRRLIVISSLETERPHAEDRALRPANPVVYTAANGLIAMCSNCRRTRRSEIPEVWDWVPGFVEARPENVTHGLCPACLYHYLAGAGLHETDLTVT